LFDLVVLIAALSSMLKAADDDEKIRPLIDKTVAMHRAWGPKTSSPGTTLMLQESSRGHAGDHTVVKYRVVTSGLPSEKIYSLVAWPLDGQPRQVLTGIMLNENGIAVCPGRPGTCGDASHPDDPIDLAVSAGLAEPKRFGLISADQMNKVFVSYIPFPNRSVDSDCVLEETLLASNAEAVIVRGSGFQAGAKLDIQALGNGERLAQSAKANESGVYEMVLLPFKRGSTKGQTSVVFRTDSCAPSLSFDWGTDSYRLQ
jgi:hypothetical protein